MRGGPEVRVIVVQGVNHMGIVAAKPALSAIAASISQ